MTAKQHEVLRFVAENRTSKEIAFELGISESAVNQRIEGVRNRTGSPPRAELARAYRQYLHELDNASNLIPAKIPQVAADGVQDRTLDGEDAVDGTDFAAGVAYGYVTPSKQRWEPRVVPGVLDGAHAGLNRTAAMVAIAAALLLVAMIGLSVARTLSDLF
ncbi:MAG TPA: helix-turn-helix transcriptional regulator [Novosphingobium sp.]|nr:helix-turn-helix transcriptional regulator [Novosphingobium sp.]